MHSQRDDDDKNNEADGDGVIGDDSVRRAGAGCEHTAYGQICSVLLVAAMDPCRWRAACLCCVQNRGVYTKTAEKMIADCHPT